MGAAILNQLGTTCVESRHAPARRDRCQPVARRRGTARQRTVARLGAGAAPGMVRTPQPPSGAASSRFVRELGRQDPRPEARFRLALRNGRVPDRRRCDAARLVDPRLARSPGGNRHGARRRRRPAGLPAPPARVPRGGLSGADVRLPRARHQRRRQSGRLVRDPRARGRDRGGPLCAPPRPARARRRHRNLAGRCECDPRSGARRDDRRDRVREPVHGPAGADSRRRGDLRPTRGQGHDRGRLDRLAHGVAARCRRDSRTDPGDSADRAASGAADAWNGGPSDPRRTHPHTAPGRAIGRALDRRGSAPRGPLRCRPRPVASPRARLPRPQRGPGARSQPRRSQRRDTASVRREDRARAERLSSRSRAVLPGPGCSRRSRSRSRSPQRTPGCAALGSSRRTRRPADTYPRQ